MASSSCAMDAYRITDPEREIQMAWERLNILVGKVAELELENQRLKNSRSKIEGSHGNEERMNKDTRESMNELNETRQRLDDLTHQLVDSEEQISQLNDEVAFLKTQLSENLQLLHGKDELLLSLRQQHEIELRQQIEQLSQRHRQDMTKREENLRDSQQDIESLRKELTELRAAHRNCDSTRQELMERKNEQESTQQLRHAIQTIEAQLKNLKQDISESFNQLSPRSQQTNREETDRQILNLSLEFDRIKVELEKMMTECDTQRLVSVQQRLRAKEKYYELRRASKTEQERLLERVRRLESTLSLTEQELKKEQEFRERTTSRDLELHDENRNLLNRCIEEEEGTRELKHEMTLLKSKVKRLKSENSILNDRNESLMKRLHEVNLTIMKASLDKDRMTTANELYKMLSGNSPDKNRLAPPSILLTPPV